MIDDEQTDTACSGSVVLWQEETYEYGDIYGDLIFL